MGRIALDLDGQRFGRLVATNELRVNSHGNERERLCHCDCDKHAWVKTSYLVRGYTKSCGCWRDTFRTLQPGQAARNQVWRDYTANAKARELSWELTSVQFDDLMHGICFFCQRPPKTIRKARRKDDISFTYNGIDRLDNNLGYTINNVVSCCMICNRAKGNMSLEDFLNWTKDLSEAFHAKN